MRPAATCIWIPVIGCLGACAANPMRHDDVMAALVASALSAPGRFPIQPARYRSGILATDFPIDMLIDSVRRHRPAVRHREFVFE